MFRYATQKGYTKRIPAPANPTFQPSHYFVKKSPGCSHSTDVESYVCREPLGEQIRALNISDRISVVTFNLLSGTFSDFSKTKSIIPTGESNPAVCQEHEPVRWQQTLDVLESYMKGDYVICLQEANFKVRMNAMLHELFDRYAYTAVMTNYGCIKNAGQLYHGFLGVGVLVPPTLKLVNYSTPFFTTHTGMKDRKVTVVELRDCKGRHVVVSSVHVPCMYQDPKLMSQFVREIATTVKTTMESWCRPGDTMPYIVAGDWNMNYWDGKELAQLGLQAAHRFCAANYTNFGCKVVDGDIKTTFYMLDYCFYSKGFKAVQAAELATIPDEPGFYLPNLEFPSDHLPIEATFTLADPEGQSCLEALTDRLLSA